ncbi:D-aspartate oxidase [Plakobranchus ocellatus]|uniref:D-aspartate oxidase n=1 Tax=Plakobranchus ocellatus TaxID=259542 RepID=A0AAV4CB27_9GAST|nr:D-aspartate oxidase [Plakobranchus ocellatus]
MFPHQDYVLMGGIREKDNWSVVPDPSIRQTILKRAQNLFPHLKHAPVVGEWVGLRPGRRSVRLQMELLRCGRSEKPLPVIHNYGHSGDGITLSWGCALEAARLVKEAVSSLKLRL